MLQHFLTPDGKMSYFDIWGFIKSFRLRTFEISPDDIEPALLREMKGSDKDIILEMDDDIQRTLTIEEDGAHLNRSLSGFTDNSFSTKRESSSNEPLPFYRLHVEP